MKYKREVPVLNASDIVRFYKKISIPENSDNCWIWTGQKPGKRPYGLLKIGQKNYYAHRIMFFLIKKEQPFSMLVCHSCDNPCCCNPDHLFLGTDHDNMRDMISKGRANKANGEKVNTSKLKSDDVLSIIRLSDSGVSKKDLSKKYGISLTQIYYIVNKKVWKHLH